jgi:hypothetical protein
MDFTISDVCYLAPANGQVWVRERTRSRGSEPRASGADGTVAVTN